MITNIKALNLNPSFESNFLKSMKIIFLLYFIIIPKVIFAQNSFESKSADSLFFAGYFKEELQLRQKLAVSSDVTNKLEHDFMLENTQCNLFLQANDLEKAKVSFSKLAVQYQKSTQKQALVFWLKITESKILRYEGKHNEALKILNNLFTK